MQSAFWDRNWTAMDSIYREAVSSDNQSPKGAEISSRDISLYVNALWMQKRYTEGLALMESAGEIFPRTLAPYAGMLSVLGMERLGQKQEAFGVGKKLWASAPEPLRFYLGYALGRLARDLEAKEEALSWFRRMLEAAPDKQRRVDALREIVALPGATVDEAALLLIDQPSNAKAFALCAPISKGASTKVDYALGYHAYIRKNYSEAGERLALAYKDGQYGEAARYYHAYALYREKKIDSAFQIWSGVVLYGKDYPQRSIQRLTGMASSAKKDDVVRVFRKVATTRGDYPDLAADALVGLVRLGEGNAVSVAEAELFRRFPSSAQAATALWEKGWKAWKVKNFKVAEEAWAKGYTPALKNRELAARLLYWRGRALENLGDGEAMKKMGDLLALACPGEYYTYLLRPDGGLTSADIPAAYMATSELEDWGFVTYARLEAASEGNGRDPAALLRATRLAYWEGDFSSAVRAFAVFQRAAEAESLSSSALAKFAYPRAFESDVASAAGRTGLDPAIIWGIMRQESLYEPDVTSSAGAYGLMQLMPGTAKGEEQKMKLPAGSYKKPSGNIVLGSNHMIGLLARFKDLPRALAAYNAGGSPVARWSKDGILDMAEWIEDIPYSETRGYVKAVVRNVESYRSLYGSK